MALLIDIICAGGDLRGALVTESEESGWEARTHDSIGDLVKAAGVSRPTVVLLVPDRKVEDGGRIPGYQDLEDWRKKNAATQILLLPPQDMERADRLALELGARHTLCAPYRRGDLNSILGKIAEGLGRRRRDEALRSRAEGPSGFEDIIGTSEAMREVMALAMKVAQSQFTSVMITGENGTGKGALARAIHQFSDRAGGPFVEVNCAAIPRNLLESEFFGYEKGAFTDAKERKLGLFECANEGTVFLDEVGEIDFNLQAKLLKFLDTRTVRRVSGTQFLPVDVRIISATNRDLAEDIEAKRFRVDLYYRLNVVEIRIPPLRERVEDIRPIAEKYTGRYSRKLKKGKIELAGNAVELLESYSWPGNIRELINMIERAVLLDRKGRIEAGDLPIPADGRTTAGGEGTTCTLRKEQGTLRIDLPPGGVSLDEVERALIFTTLVDTEGNISRAARNLGIERGTLRYKMKKHGIDGGELREKIKNGEYEPALSNS